MRRAFDIALITVLLVLSTANVIAQERARRVKPSTPDSKSLPQGSVTSKTVEEVGAGDVIHVDTTLVTIPVSVRDRQGRFIYDLNKEDFSVFENGAEQEIAFFETTETPFTVILMLDTSSSTWLKHEKIKDAAIAFVNQLRPEDRVAVLTFANEVAVLTEPTNDRTVLQRAIRKAGRGFNTRLYDAVDWVIRERLKQIRGRKAVVILTDGVDAKSKSATYESNMRDVDELDALVYPIQYDTYKDQAILSGGMSTPQASVILNLPPISSRLPSSLPRPRANAPDYREGYKIAGRYLRGLAEKTGGRFYQAGENISSLQVAFSQIVGELGHQYRLGYYPKIKALGRERRQIRVRVTRADVAVRTRDSYIYTSSSDANNRKTTAQGK